MKFNKALAKQLGSEYKDLKAQHEEMAKQVESGELPDSPEMQAALNRMAEKLQLVDHHIGTLRGM